MSASLFSSRLIRGALLLSALLTVGATVSLHAQQAPAPAAALVAPAPAAVDAPAPAASPLFANTDPRAPTIANAQAANRASINEGGSHTIVVSTLVLVLGIIILVLLID